MTNEELASDLEELASDLAELESDAHAAYTALGLVIDDLDSLAAGDDKALVEAVITRAIFHLASIRDGLIGLPKTMPPPAKITVPPVAEAVTDVEC